jgi:hypothetical protein
MHYSTLLLLQCSSSAITHLHRSPPGAEGCRMEKQRRLCDHSFLSGTGTALTSPDLTASYLSPCSGHGEAEDCSIASSHLCDLSPCSGHVRNYLQSSEQQLAPSIFVPATPPQMAVRFDQLHEHTQAWLIGSSARELL